MLDDQQLDDLFELHHIPDRGRTAIRALRKRPPLRRVTGGGSSESGRYPSHLMERTLQWESKNELAELRRAHRDPSTLEVWDQALELVADGQRQVIDYIEVRTTGFVAVAVMPRSDITKSLEAGETRYAASGNGRWHEPAFDAAAERLGLRYEIVTDEELPAVLIGNLDFLAPYQGAGYEVDERFAERVHRLLRNNPGMTIAEILRTRGFEGRGDDLFVLVAHAVVFVRLDAQPLADSIRTRVFGSAAIALLAGEPADPKAGPRGVRMVAGERVTWDGVPYEIVNVGADAVELRGETRIEAVFMADFARRVRSGSIVGITGRGDDAAEAAVASATPASRERAAERAKAVSLARAGLPTEASDRSLRRWTAAADIAEAAGIPAAIRLIDRPRRGRGPQLPCAVEDVIEEVLLRMYAAPEAPTVADIARLIAEACDEAGLVAPHERTIYKRVRAFERHRSHAARLGDRGAYRGKPPFMLLDGSTPIHGSRPWEWAHIDHTQLDVVVVDRETGLVLGRPWLTLLVDAHTRRVLAFWLTLEPPSRASVLAVLRVCAQRWGRLPEAVVHDGGKEFESEDVQTFCAFHDVMLVRRPRGPRHGTVVERLFGTNDTMFVHLLAANTKATKNVRAMSSNMNPENFAVWDLAALYAATARFLHGDYDQRPHPALGDSPRGFYTTRVELTGLRTHRLLVLDETLLVLTMPSPPRRKARVRAGSGVHILNHDYWHDAFDAEGVADTYVEVRYDPADVRHAWAFVNGTWIEVRCLALAHLPQLSEDEVKILTAERRARMRGTKRARAISDTALGKSFAHLRMSEERLRQRAKDRDNALTAALAVRTFDDYGALVDRLTGGAPVALPAAAILASVSPEGSTARRPGDADEEAEAIVAELEADDPPADDPATAVGGLPAPRLLRPVRPDERRVDAPDGAALARRVSATVVRDRPKPELVVLPPTPVLDPRLLLPTHDDLDEVDF